MSERKPLTVSALTDYIKYKFDNDAHLKDVYLEGEVSNFKKNVRGHFYFTLKDDNASISAVMFRGNAWKVRFTPKDGMSVLVRGYVSVFKVAGSYQVYVEEMQEVGLGNLYRRYLELKEELEKKGYFDDKHKKELPVFPKQVAVLTSATGAAVKDIIHIINRRYPLVKILVYPTTVQGEAAKEEIRDNLQKAGANPENDLIILGRGGGSIEDLWAFNEEMVAEAIYNCPIPVISAVGHETDFTIADFVADKRAPTPSGAAEIAVPDQKSLHRDIDKMKASLYDSLQRLVERKRETVEELGDRYVMKDPARLLMPFERRLEHLRDKLRILSPANKTREAKKNLRQLEENLAKALRALLADKRRQFSLQSEKLPYVDPKRLMEKGYTLAKKQGEIIKSVQAVDAGDRLEMEFFDGSLDVEVLNKKEKDSDG